MSRTPWSRVTGLALAGTLAGLTVTAQSPLTSAALLTDVAHVKGNHIGTRAACVGGPLYAAAVLAASPSFYWRLGEQPPPAVTSVTDATSNGVTGTAAGSGLTFGGSGPGLISCDDTGDVDLSGLPNGDGFVVAPTAVANTDTFTLSAWVRTGSNRGGWVVGMGSARWGTSSHRDRVLFIRDDGRPSFTVGIGPRTVVTGPDPVNDDQPHLLVATLGPAGMVLYVDGTAVASDASVTSGATFTGNEPTDQPPPLVAATPDGFGYWRVGFDDASDLGPGAPSRNQFNGRIDEVAVWQNRALSATAVSGLYDQNHW